MGDETDMANMPSDATIEKINRLCKKLDEDIRYMLASKLDVGAHDYSYLYEYADIPDLILIPDIRSIFRRMQIYCELYDISFKGVEVLLDPVYKLRPFRIDRAKLRLQMNYLRYCIDTPANILLAKELDAIDNGKRHYKKYLIICTDQKRENYMPGDPYYFFTQKEEYLRKGSFLYNSQIIYKGSQDVYVGHRFKLKFNFTKNIPKLFNIIAKQIYDNKLPHEILEIMGYSN